MGAIGVGFDVSIGDGPADIILRNTESVFHSPVASQSTSSFDTPVILFDSYAATHLALPIAREAAKPEVKAYLRSNSFREEETYFRQAQGGSYYNHVLSSSMNRLAPDAVPRIPKDFVRAAIDKIIVRNPVLPFMNERHLEFLDGQSPLEDRYLDVIFNDRDVMDQQVKLLDGQRGGLNTMTMSDLFSDEIPDQPHYGLHYLLYLATISNAKVLVSPWGPGGFSKIDFEALLCGTIVVKPECSNVRTWIDIYDPLHGYVQYCSPCLGDLRDVILHIINNLSNYAALSQRGKKLIQQYYNSPNEGIISWLKDFRAICENVLSGNSNNLRNVEVPFSALGE